MRSKSFLGNILLLITAIIWGSAFVAQSVGNSIGPFTFQSLRSFIGGIVLLPYIFIKDRIEKKNGTYIKKNNKILLKGGIICGIALCLASCFQQIGIGYTTVGKAGFITALYILIVPILGLFMKKNIKPKIWFCVAVAVAGLYLLCMNEKFILSKGDTLVFICAVLFSLHIIIIDKVAPVTDGVKLACIQFFVTGIISAIPMIIFEHPNISSIISVLIPILYAGALSSGVGYTLQIIGQKYTKPTVASMIMSLESVFAVIAAAVILKQFPTSRELIGCTLMFLAIIIAQLPEKSDCDIEKQS